MNLIPMEPCKRYFDNQDMNFTVSREKTFTNCYRSSGGTFYLHSIQSIQLYYRDIKLNDILLYDKYREKVLQKTKSDW